MKIFAACMLLLVVGGLWLSHHIARMQDEVDQHKIDEDDS